MTEIHKISIKINKPGLNCFAVIKADKDQTIIAWGLTLGRAAQLAQLLTEASQQKHYVGFDPDNPAAAEEIKAAKAAQAAQALTKTDFTQF